MSEGNEQAAGQRWTSEFYKDARGKSPVETWLDDLGPQEFAALQAAIFHVLEPHGIGLGGTEWLKALGQGLFEFRVRHDEAEILSAHAEAGTPLPDSSPGKILLRLFVAFHGDKVVLLLSGYDKGKDPSDKRQQKEIKQARKRLTAWKLAQQKDKKKARR